MDSKPNKKFKLSGWWQLEERLNKPCEGLLNIAVDLGLELPGLVPAVAEIESFVSPRLEDVALNFSKAAKQASTEPAVAVIKAETLLATICAKLCAVYNIELRANASSHHALKNLLQGMTKKQGFDQLVAARMQTMAENLRQASAGLHELRTNNSDAHIGKGKNITDPFIATFCINVAATVGLLLLNVYDKKLALRSHQRSHSSPT